MFSMLIENGEVREYFENRCEFTSQRLRKILYVSFAQRLRKILYVSFAQRLRKILYVSFARVSTMFLFSVIGNDILSII